MYSCSRIVSACFLACACLCAALAIACGSQEERIAGARAAAGAALERGDRPAAVRVLRALRREPAATPQALLERAGLLLQVGEGLEALWDLQEGLRRFPGRDDVRLAFGWAALEVGEASAAEAALATIEPDSALYPQALLARAQARLGLGDREGALAILAHAEARYPETAEVPLLRIATLAEAGGLDEARRVLRGARARLGERSDEALLQAQVSLDAVAAAQGEVAQADADLRLLLARRPAAFPVWTALVHLLVDEGRAAEALALIDAAVDPGVAAFLPPLRALALVALGRSADALRALERHAERFPSPTAAVQLARLHTLRGEPAAAVAVIETAAKAFPDATALLPHYVDLLLLDGQLDRAAQVLQELRARAPADPSVAYLEGRIALTRGDNERAVALLLDATSRLDVSYTQLWLAKAFEARGDFREAERRYLMSLARNPIDPFPYQAAIALIARRGDWNVVAELALLMTIRLPGLDVACAQLVRALVQSDRRDAALAASEKCSDRFPESTTARLARAQALGVAGRLDEGLAILANAPPEAASAIDFANERALLLARGGKLRKALDALDAASAAGAERAPLEATRASILYASGREAEADAAVDRALVLEPADPAPLFERCRFRAATGRIEGAIRSCERYLGARPDDAQAHFVHGVALERGGFADAAVEAYRRAAELDPQAPGPCNNLALILAARGELDAALVVAQKAYALASDDPRVLDTLGQLYFEKGLVERSISFLEDARRLAPGMTEVRLHLAQTYQRAGRRAEARALLVALRDELAQGADASQGLRTEVAAALDSAPQ
jgi:tetratricopeptide (TPR) repeat protein